MVPKLHLIHLLELQKREAGILQEKKKKITLAGPVALSILMAQVATEEKNHSYLWEHIVFKAHLYTQSLCSVGFLEEGGEWYSDKLLDYASTCFPQHIAKLVVQ